MKRPFYLLFVISLILVSCGGNKQYKSFLQEHKRGAYYWKTTFKLSPWEKDFLKEHQITKLYVRLFDVAYETDYDGERKSVPIATTRFVDSLPKGIEIVPVVYITQNAISNDPYFQDILYKRIKAMANKHGFSDFKELQLDCDWTDNTREQFFGLCDSLHQLLQKDDRILSSTVRLHQLKQAAPPVDCGVLMLYNTGSIYDPAAQNSILDYKDVSPYLTKNIDYSFPLSLAYPTYSWSIALNDNEFRNILHQTDFSDSILYESQKENLFKLKKDTCIEQNYLSAGTVIRRETPKFEEIIKVKKLAASRITPITNNIIYHLDEKELSRYSKEEIEQILK